MRISTPKCSKVHKQFELSLRNQQKKRKKEMAMKKKKIVAQQIRAIDSLKCVFRCERIQTSSSIALKTHYYSADLTLNSNAIVLTLNFFKIN